MTPGPAVRIAGLGFAVCVATAVFCLPNPACAQSVGLPAPRLLTTMPMGGRAGTTVELTITGDYLEDAEELSFSDSRLKAGPKQDASGRREANRYVVQISADCPEGVYEARVITRLGVSSSRAFTVGSLHEVVRTKPNTTLAEAMELKVNSVCNAVMSTRSIDYYVFEAAKGQRIEVECATRGIDSKLNAVLIVADASGRDLHVERRGAAIDFTAPENNRYVIKVHEMTYQGGPAYYYRLVVRELAESAPLVRHPSTRGVNSFSWPPPGIPDQAPFNEAEPNNAGGEAQRISLPCDIAGSFFPAADIDVFEFEAKKGETWWVEVASERLGRPTDSTVIIQRVVGTGNEQQLIDIAELSDIPSPVKVSSNGYAYDGPPYNAGSADVLGKVDIPEDGLYRLQLTDLFGGTRSDPRNVYRLIIRKAQPDFALVAWALHMELRNGDRNALSKPISLRGGATMALEVVAIRRDGFDGDIELSMEQLPEGVSAQGLRIPSGKSHGLLLLTATSEAPRGLSSARFFGKSQIAGTEVVRPCRLASMAWPIADSWGEVPSPRLLADVPVSVSGLDQSPITITPAGQKSFEAAAGSKLTVPLRITRRTEFSGTTFQMRTAGAGFDRVPLFNIPLNSDSAEAVLDLGTLKTPPGEYTIAFYGGAVAKYRHRPDLISLAEATLRKAEEEFKATESETKRIAEEAKAAPQERKAEAEKSTEAALARQKAAAANLAAAVEELKKVTAAAQPKDIVDIVVSEPITIRVKPAEIQ